MNYITFFYNRLFVSFPSIAIFYGIFILLFSTTGMVGADDFHPVFGEWESRCGTPVVKENGNDQQQAAPREFLIRGGARNEFFLRIQPDEWSDASEMEWRFAFDSTWPEGTRICFFTKDRDHLWRQISLPWRQQAEFAETVYHLPLQGGEAFSQWAVKPHQRPWHVLTLAQLHEVGFRIELPPGQDDFQAALKLRDLRLLSKKAKVSPPSITDVELLPSQPRVGELVEIRLQVDAAYENPFDRQDIAVDLEVVRPDGKSEKVMGFYYEGFLSETDRPQARLLPYGPPEFRIRYTPGMEGEHKLRITVDGRGGEVGIPVFSFSALAAAADYDGFIRVDPRNPLHLAYDSGRVFTGIGLNIRTPSDLRYLQMNPASTWRDEGLEVYRRMLPKLAEAGVNVIEVWMASWWLALEWINDAPGFHGVGYFNPYRAWKLDQLLRLAEENGIYIILVLNNHGKFSTFCDQEWHRNPYNQDNGGFLSCSDLYFSDEEARRAFKRTADYIVARWGYSPHILMWKLFSEINLTGTSSRVYRQPPMRRWHREMSEYLKQIDPYQHLVTTHWSSNYRVINDSIAELEEIDVLTTDAYSDRTEQVLTYFTGTMQYAERMNKPTIITEFGGPPRGDSVGVLKKQLRLGLWKGYFLDSSIIPMLWWFGFVHEYDQYGEFAALAAYQKGEDRRDMKTDGISFADQQVEVRTLSGTDRILIWGYDREYYHSRQENLKPRQLEGLSLVLDEELKDGTYRLEIWHGKTDRPVTVTELQVTGNQGLEIEIPRFKRDFALKIVPVD